MKKNNYSIITLLVLVPLLLTGCSIYSSIFLTVYNSTKVVTGDFVIQYGDGNSRYVDDSIELTNPAFPYLASLEVKNPSAEYLVIIALESDEGIAARILLLDTTAEESSAKTTDKELLIDKTKDQFEPDNEPALAETIQVNEFQPRSFDVTGDEDYACAYFETGNTCTIETVIPDDSKLATDTVLYLYDTYLNVLDTDDNGGDSKGSLISWNAAASGLCPAIKAGNSRFFKAPVPDSVSSYPSFQEPAAQRHTPPAQ